MDLEERRERKGVCELKGGHKGVDKMGGEASCGEGRRGECGKVCEMQK